MFMGIGKRRTYVAMGLCLILCTASLAVLKASTPVLYTTQEHYCGIYNPGWGIYGTDADPYETVTFTEYKWNGSQWAVIWGPANVTTTYDDGTFAWYTYGPNSPGFYYAKVTVNGQTSNEAHYYVSAGC
jgi:hypothetical protein